MEQTQLTEAHIAYALHEGEVGTLVAAIGASEQTFYRWKKFAGMGLAELRRRTHLEEEHRTRKQLVADVSLDTRRLQEAIRNKLERRRRNATLLLRVGFNVSERLACQTVGIGRSSYRSMNTAKDQTVLTMRIRDLAAARVCSS